MAEFLRLSRTRAELLSVPSGYTPAWIRDGRPTAQALAIIEILKQADSRGLDPEDYDGSRWAARLAGLRKSHHAGETAVFDAALTVCLMRYISDNHIGKVNPRALQVRTECRSQEVRLARFPAGTADQWAGCKSGVSANRAVLCRIQADARRATALSATGAGGRRREASGSGETCFARKFLRWHSAIDQPAAPGGRSARRTQRLPADSKVYQGELVDAVKRFQSRHGRTADGKLDRQRWPNLNTPSEPSRRPTAHDAGALALAA